MQKRILTNDDIENIINMTKKYLAHNYESCKSFYNSIFLKSNEFDYLVFPTRHSFVIAEIFYNILIKEYENDEENQNKIKEATNKFCTKSRFISLSNEVANKLLESNITKVNIVLDILAETNDLNELLYKFHKTVIEVLNIKKINFSEKKVEDIINQNLEINTFILKEKKNMNDLIFELKYEYKKNLFYKENYVSKEFNYFLNTRDLLVNILNLSNQIIGSSVFLKSEEIKLPQIDNFKKYEITTLELSQTIYIHKNTFGKMASTIIVTRYDDSNEYKIVPYIFMPNVEKSIFNSLENEMKLAIKDNGIFNKLDSNGRYEINLLYLNKLLVDTFFKELKSEINIKDDDLSIDYMSLKANYGFEDKEIENLYDKKNQELKLFTECAREIISETKDNLFDSNELRNFEKIEEKEELSYLIENYIYFKKLNHIGNFSLFFGEVKKDIKLMDLYEQVEPNPLGEFISLVVHYIDTGLLNLKLETKDNIYSQYLKEEESALTIMPRRYVEHTPSLNIVLHSVLSYIDKEEAINEYIEALRRAGINDLRKTIAKELFTYNAFLDKSNQTKEEWDFNMTFISDEFKNRGKYGKIYIDYDKEKRYGKMKKK